MNSSIANRGPLRNPVMPAFTVHVHWHPGLLSLHQNRLFLPASCLLRPLKPMPPNIPRSLPQTSHKVSEGHMDRVTATAAGSGISFCIHHCPHHCHKIPRRTWKEDGLFTWFTLLEILIHSPGSVQAWPVVGENPIVGRNLVVAGACGKERLLTLIFYTYLFSFGPETRREKKF